MNLLGLPFIRHDPRQGDGPQTQADRAPAGAGWLAAESLLFPVPGRGLCQVRAPWPAPLRHLQRSDSESGEKCQRWSWAQAWAKNL